MKKLLAIKNLHVRFHDTHAVRGIDFYLHAGETLAIVGESGCGKSATAKALVGLHDKESTQLSGEILFGDTNLRTLPESKLQKIRGKDIGMIFQDPMTSLNPTKKVGEQIIEGYLRHHPDANWKEARSVGLDMMCKAAIPDPESRMDCYPHVLSGGLRQRVMIALALICKPKILIADEPTTALDGSTQHQILNLLKVLRAEMDLSVLLITHNMQLVADFCDRVLIMYAGKIVESAPVKELFSNPQHPYTKLLLGAIPPANISKQQRLISIDGEPPNLALSLNHCGFCNRCPVAMNICAKESPPVFSIAENHFCSCFKHDPRCHQ